MKSGLAILFALVALVALCTAQTFQYSRGWTNGKRAIGAVDVDGKVGVRHNSYMILFFVNLFVFRGSIPLCVAAKTNFYNDDECN